jgi:hypothetical protein
MRRTTLAIEERLWERIREKARREGRDFQDCANRLLTRGIEAEKKETGSNRKKRLPTFSMGKALVDISDREALYEAMENE